MSRRGYLRRSQRYENFHVLQLPPRFFLHAAGVYGYCRLHKTYLSKAAEKRVSICPLYPKCKNHNFYLYRNNAQPHRTSQHPNAVTLHYLTALAPNCTAAPHRTALAPNCTATPHLTALAPNCTATPHRTGTQLHSRTTPHRTGTQLHSRTTPHRTGAQLHSHTAPYRTGAQLHSHTAPHWHPTALPLRATTCTAAQLHNYTALPPQGKIKVPAEDSAGT